MLAVGTRGDVQPYVALGRGLLRAGHDVVIATNANLAAFAREHGVDAAAITGDSTRWTAWLAAAPRRARPDRLAGALRRQAGALEETLAGLAAAALGAARRADLVVSGSTAFWAGQPIARALGVPHCAAFIQPWHPTSAFAPVLWPELAAGPAWARGAYNRAAHRLTVWGLRRLFAAARRRALTRALGGVPAPYAADPLVLYGFSPAWLPRPADWPGHVRVTGFWFLDAPGWRPPPRLAAFLAAGPPPVYVGFGSLAGVRPDLLELAVEALARAGGRGLLAMGWGRWRGGALSGDVLALDDVPHDWLFRQVAAVVHHGGAGTTAAALRAGRPSVAVPFLHDHGFFARQVWRRGLGPRPVPAARATVARLREAIERAVDDGAMAFRAARLASEIACEDGVGRAVELIGTCRRPG